MFRRLLTLLLVGKAFRMLSAKRHGYAGLTHSRAYSRGWGSRHTMSSDLNTLFGLHRRRRSFI